MSNHNSSVPAIATVRDRRLSLWQSAVAHVVREEFLAQNPEADTAAISIAIRDHHAMRAASAHTLAQEQGLNIHHAGDLLDRFRTSREAFAASQIHFERAEAMRLGDTERLAALDDVPVRQYSTDDYAGWATCLAEYLSYYVAGLGTPYYRDWQDPNFGNGNIDYSVIEYQLPPDSTVAILGDWGTGMPDAVGLLSAIMAMNPTAIIHLGDIYYSGTAAECTTNFLNVVQAAYQQAGVKIPIFTLPGNHEYYSGGAGYYQLLDELAAVQPSTSCQQPASYFCLRTSDNAWQFLGMDTGYNDHTIGQLSGPWLQPNEITWHVDKLTNFSGKTILLSHHQLFSANATINSYPWDTAYLNDYLFATFQPYFPSVAGWLWGHEHNLVLYQNDIFGLGMGRLIGCSAYEETQEESPYTVNYPEVPYLAGAPQLSVTDSYYNHGFAMVTMTSGQTPTITYYQFPSWGSYDAPTNPQPTQLFEESFVFPSSFTTQIWETSLPGCGYNIVSALAANGQAYAGSNGYVYLLNPESGAVVQTNSLPSRGRNEIRMTYIANSNAASVVLGTDGYAVGLDPNSIATQWQTSLPGCGYNIVSVTNDGTNVYAGSNGYVYSIDPSTGNVLYTNSLSGTGSDEVRMVLNGSVLYIGTNGYALALNTSDLSTIWKTSLSGCGYNITSVETDGNYLFAGCNGYVYQLNLSDGSVVNTNGLSGMGHNEIRFAQMDGTLYVGTDGYALGLSTSDISTQWQVSLPSCGYTIVTMLAQDGQVFAGSNGYVYRLTPGAGTPFLYTNGLPGLGRNEIRFDLADDILLVGTNGYMLGLTSTASSTTEQAMAAGLILEPNPAGLI